MKKLMKTLLMGLTYSLLAITSIEGAGWTPIQTITNAIVGTKSQFTPTNNLLVTWVGDFSGAENVTAAFLLPTGLLSPSVVLGSPGVDPESSVNPATGDAVAVWRGDGRLYTIEASNYNATSGTWTPTTLDANPLFNNLGSPHVSYSASGTAVAVWISDNGDGNLSIIARVYNGSWGAPVSSSIPYGVTPVYTTPENGPYAAVMWIDDSKNFVVQKFTASGNSGAWTEVHNETLTQDFNKGAQIAIENSGNIATLIPYDNAGSQNLLGWASGQALAQVITGFDCTNFLLAVDNAGKAYAAWSTLDGIGNPSGIQGTHFFFGSSTAWPAATLYLQSDILVGSISPDINGNLYVALGNLTDVSLRYIQEATYTATTAINPGSWSSVITVSDTTSNHLLSAAAIDTNPSGAVLLSWLNGDFSSGGPFAIQETHKSATGSFIPFLTVTSGLENGVLSNSYISNDGHKAIVTGIDLVRFQNIAAPLNNPIFLTVYIDDVVVGPNPPTGFIGKGGKNKFLTQTERFNTLTWTASTSTNVVAYSLYRNGALIAIIPADGPLVYVDHNRNKHVVDTYTIYAVDVGGNASTGVVVVLP